jgi:class 3 adenylate cyclase
MESSGRTLVCSVLFLDIAGYSTRSVADQLALKNAFNRILSAAVARVPSHNRVILDTGDGAAITFLGSPEDALRVGVAVRDEAGALPVRMGINLGPVRLVKDVNGQTSILGDGINVSQRVMSFSEPGQILVSHAFYDVVARLSKEYERMFVHEGSRTDKHVRAHEVYSVAAGAHAPRHTAPAVAPGAEAGAPPPVQLLDAGPQLIVSGYTRSGVQKELDRLAREGAVVISPITRVGSKWVATCERPGAARSACRVEEFGLKRMVTGPTREAVAAKVEELEGLGAVLVGEVERTEDGWTAVLDTAGAGR